MCIAKIDRLCTGGGVVVYPPISMCHIHVDVRFSIQTGAEVTIMSKKLFGRILQRKKIQLVIFAVIVSFLTHLLEAKVKFECKRQTDPRRKELLPIVCVVYFVQYVRQFLLDRDYWCVVRIGHSALRWLMSLKDPRDQMAQRLGVVSQYSSILSCMVRKSIRVPSNLTGCRCCD